MNNEIQVHELPGPLLLLAGPGTGKTYRLAKRIKYLVEAKKVDPQNITVITFTAAAARNMHERISDLARRPELYIPHENQPKLICTMHSLGYRILREKVSALGLSDTPQVVYSDRLRDILVEDAAQLAGFKRDDGRETAKCRQYGKCNPSNDRKCKICKEYQNILRTCSAFDYDDQILLACRFLKEDSELLKKYRSCCSHLLVDEYQDINAGQFELICILSEGQHEGLFVVGDDDQSIYSWRGGSPEFIRNFKKHFGDKSQIRSLQKSFRCQRNVLEGAIAIVSAYDFQRVPKGEFGYEIESGKKIQVHNVPSHKREAFIVRSIIESVPSSRSILVLLPHRGFSKAIVEELRKARIAFNAPLTLPGEGLPLISILSQWLTNNSDSLAFRECLESLIDNPEFGIPSRSSKLPEKKQERESAFLKISKLWEHVINKDVDSFWRSLDMVKGNDELYSKAFSAFDELRELCNAQDDPGNFIAEVVRKLAPWKKTQHLLEEIDSWVQTAERIGGVGGRLGVQLVTLQSAKGLEADVVCVVGLEDGILPKSGSSTESIAEQSRLMFVSMTRAIEELHLFHARKRSGDIMFKPVYKKGKPPDIKPSCFINAIPNERKEIKYHPT